MFIEKQHENSDNSTYLKTDCTDAYGLQYK